MADKRWLVSKFGLRSAVFGGISHGVRRSEEPFEDSGSVKDRSFG